LIVMHETLVTFETGAITHAGKVRTRNEDSYLAHPESGVWAVADGMGGHEAGDLASQTVVQALSTIARPSSPAELLRQCEERIVYANHRLLEIADERGGLVIGSTVAVLLTFGGHFACVWSGDSRVYLIRGGEIAQISRDHTQVQQLVEEGAITAEEARNWPGRNVITRAIGVNEDPELELMQGALTAGDTFVVCSDGLTGHVTDAEIMEHVVGSRAQAACEALVELTLARYQPRGFTSVGGLAKRGGWG
jgi:protein phosphatase